MTLLLAAALLAADPAPPRWWVRTPDGATHGPVTAAEFERDFGARRGDVLVHRMDGDRWIPAADEPGLVPDATPPSAAGGAAAGGTATGGTAATGDAGPPARNEGGAFSSARFGRRYALDLLLVALTGLLHYLLLARLYPPLVGRLGAEPDAAAIRRAAALPAAGAALLFAVVAPLAPSLAALSPLLGAVAGGLLPIPALFAAVWLGSARLLGVPAATAFLFPLAAAAAYLPVALAVSLLLRLLGLGD